METFGRCGEKLIQGGNNSEQLVASLSYSQRHRVTLIELKQRDISERNTYLTLASQRRATRIAQVLFFSPTINRQYEQSEATELVPPGSFDQALPA